MTAAFVGPMARVSVTKGSPVKASTARAGSGQAAMMSMSPTVSSRRRRLPAGVALGAMGRRAAQISSASGSALPSRMRSSFERRVSMLRRMFSPVFLPTPGNASNRPSWIAFSNASSVVTPRSAPIL